MKTLSVVSHKGGAGKTSSAVMFAEEFANRGLRVVLVDADRQKGAGLLLGIEQPTGVVQPTSNPRLRYFCSSGIPLKQLPERAEEFTGQFDLAVVDTPSLDDPLAKGWIQLSTHVLMVLPVEPVSVRTLDGADSALEKIQQLNPHIRGVGTLPTMFDEQDATQRTLMLELMSLRPEGLLSPTIPHDRGLAHRAEQKTERRTEPAESTRQAYRVVAEALVGTLGLQSPGSGSSSEAPPAWSRREPGAAGANVAPGFASAPGTQIPMPAAPPAWASMPASGSKKPGWHLKAIGAALAVALAAGAVLFRPGRSVAPRGGKLIKTSATHKGGKGTKNVRAKQKKAPKKQH
jgi:cellulose biosynthesis protein BcsQ